MIFSEAFFVRSHISLRGKGRRGRGEGWREGEMHASLMFSTFGPVMAMAPAVKWPVAPICNVFRLIRFSVWR